MLPHPYYEEPDIKIYQGHILRVLKTFDDESANTIITSPPYWGLRDYGEDTKTIWDGDPSCEHKWETERTARPNQGGGKGHLQDANKGNFAVDNQDRSTYSDFCSKCGAWHGQLGLEPTLDLYLSHLWQITDELYRVLKKIGILFWNHGDSYHAHGARQRADEVNWSESSWRSGNRDSAANAQASYKKYDTPDKCLNLQNYRLILGMIDIDYRILVEWRVLGRPQGKLGDMLKHPKIRGILRNSIIWNKPNHMPSSVKDRFANAYEPVFMLTKNSNPIYYYNIKTGLMADRKAKDPKENIDWEWRDCPNCKGTGKIEKEGECKRCKGTGKIKYSFWRALDYWFDLDAVRLPHKESSIERAKYPLNVFGNPIERRPTMSGKRILLQEGKRTKIPQGQAETFGSPKVERMWNAPEPSEPNAFNLTGKNPGDVWTIPTQPFPEAHFATFPEELVKPMILAGCPKQVCKKCGKARVRITKIEGDGTTEKIKRLGSSGKRQEFEKRQALDYAGGHGDNIRNRQTIGWTDCGCNAGWTPGIVLDPFVGAGAVLCVAKNLGYAAIGIDIKKEYCNMSVKGIKNITPSLPFEG